MAMEFDVIESCWTPFGSARLRLRIAPQARTYRGAPSRGAAQALVEEAIRRVRYAQQRNAWLSNPQQERIEKPQLNRCGTTAMLMSGLNYLAR